LRRTAIGAGFDALRLIFPRDSNERQIKEGESMLGFFSRIIPIFALAWVLTGCQALTGETLGQNIDDTNVTAAVKTQLARDKVSTLTRIDVDTHRGVVSLNGVVESAEQRARAEQIARGVSGVRGVTNNLQVQR
jgi:hypothetical protein